MRGALLVLGLLAFSGFASATYWNYGFVVVESSGGEVAVYHAWCAGDGIPAPLVVVDSAPDPRHECHKTDPLVALP